MSQLPASLVPDCFTIEEPANAPIRLNDPGPLPPPGYERGFDTLLISPGGPWINGYDFRRKPGSPAPTESAFENYTELVARERPGCRVVIPPAEQARMDAVRARRNADFDARNHAAAHAAGMAAGWAAVGDFGEAYRSAVNLWWYREAGSPA